MSASNMSRRMTIRRTLCVAVPVVVVIVVLVLLRGCKKEPEPGPSTAEALFVPRDLGRLKNLDRDGVIEYCRTQIRPANYEGILRGPHGALWAGEANAWDRAMLAVAALEGLNVEARVVPGDPPRVAYKDGLRWTTVRVDAQADAEHGDQPPADSLALADLPTQRPELFHRIEAAFVIDQEGGGQARIAPTAADRIADWAYRPVTINTVGEGAEMKYRLQVGDLVTSSVGVDGVRRARLELTWRFKDKTAVWTRELFDRANVKPDIPGRDVPRTGDQYAIVLAAGPLAAEVVPTRSRMFELPLYTPVEDERTRELLRLGIKYQVDSDERSRALAADCGVSVAWMVPRITIVGSEIPVDGKGEPGLSVDALADAVEASGERAREFHVARGLATDLVETRVLYEARRVPVISTSTVFSNFKADSPDSPARRVARIETEARRMLAHEPMGTKVVLTAMPPRSMPPEEVTKTPNRPTLTIERTPTGLALGGLAQNKTGDAPWQAYEWQETAAVAFADRARELATVADGMLARKAEHLDYMLAFDVRSMWPRQSLPVVAGSVLTYVVRSKDKTEHIAVEVGLKNGVPTGTWTNLENGKKGPASSKWPDVVVDGPQGLSIESWFSPTAVDGESAKVAVRIGENPREVDGHKLADGSATVLAGAGLPILLEWRRGDVSLRLESATPVAFGSTRDADTGLPAPASVALTRTVRAPSRTKDDSSKSKDKKDAPKAGLRTQVELRRVDTAADGSFALAVPAEKRRLILVLDRSGSMIFSLNPRDGRKRSDLPAPAGKQRMDYLRRAVHGLLDKTPPGVEVTLWSFATGPVDRDDDNPRHVKIECPFTTDLDRVRKAMDAVQITNGTPITGAIHKILNHVAEDPLSANAHIVLLTDGENTSSNPAAKAYQDRNGSVPIHTIGFAIEAGGKAEKELRDIAEVSGGTYRIAGTGDELALAFAKIDTAAPDTRLAVTSTCHAPENIVIPAKELGGKSLDVRLSHGCATCKCSDKSLLTIRKDNVARLDKCVGLSPKARSMIEDRVKDGLWTVTIPSVRVNLGVISAYAWWETENATGRMVGRTEDGLHGATMDPRSWPGAAASGAGNIPFVAWYMGIVAYTAGSVEAAMRWTREPGFMAGGPEGFKRFVQANALDFCGRWWSEVGASAFPENIHNYWSGVCFNFALQSMALGLPAGNCFRQWAGAMCDQAAGAAKGAPGKAFDDYFGKEYREIYSRAKKLAEQLGPDSSADVNLFMDEMDRFKKAWDEGIDRTFPCDRLRGGSAKLP